jgi:hypothetical protein
MPISVAPSVGQRPRHGPNDAPNSICCGDLELTYPTRAGFHNPSALFPVPDRHQATPLYNSPAGRPNTGQPISAAALARLILMHTVMTSENALSYRVSRNGSAGDWYWEVISDRKIIDRGLAPTSTQARAQALKVAASHALWQPTDSTRFFKGPQSTEAP